MVPALVLVVDDQEPIRALVRNILKATGIKALDAASGPEALEIIQQRNFDLVITDLIMPGMDGLQLIRELRERRFPCRCLLMTGFASHPIPGQEDVPILAKPFTAAQLIAAVQALDPPAPVSVPTMQAELRQARAEWREATRHLRDVTADIASFAGPDGRLALTTAGRKQAASFRKYKEALRTYGDRIARARISTADPQTAKQPSPAELHRHLTQARAEWERSIAELDQILSGIPSKIPQPDGTSLIERAGLKRKQAFEKYKEALERYESALTRLPSPDDASADQS